MNDQIIEEPYPFQAHVGFDVVDWSDGFCRLEQPVIPHLGNRYGIPHGGVMATLIDTAMGYACTHTGDPDNRRLVMTLSLNVNYVGQVQGRLMICEGRKTGGGRKTAFAEAIITDDTGALIATGTGVFRYRTTT